MSDLNDIITKLTDTRNAVEQLLSALDNLLQKVQPTSGVATTPPQAVNPVNPDIPLPVTPSVTTGNVSA